MKFKKFLAALAVGVAGSLAAVAPAQAAAADCPSGMFCLWIDGNYSGARYQVSWQTIQGGTNNGITIASWMDDEGSALYNRTGRDLYVYDGWHCESTPSGVWYRLIPNGQKLTAPGSAINDRISSVQLWNAFPLNC
jgi:hypothetical protein